jgi:hypothetical protein
MKQEKKFKAYQPGNPAATSDDGVDARSNSRLIAIAGVLTVALLIAIVAGRHRAHRSDTNLPAKTVQTQGDLPTRKSTKSHALDGDNRINELGRVRGERELSSVVFAWCDAAREHLKLTDDQKVILAADFVDCMHRRAELEKRLLKVDSFDGTTLKITIPQYQEQGLAMRDAFYKQLGRDLPADVVERVDDALGTSFDAFCRGYGQMVQEFEIENDSANSGAVRIRWSSSLPAGGSQTPGSAIPFGGYVGAGTLTVDEDDMYSGEYEALRESVLAYFKPH